MAGWIRGLTVVAVTAPLVLPAGAAAKPGCGGTSTTTTPGTSEVNQYTETVPGVCGDHTNEEDGTAGGGGVPTGGDSTGGGEAPASPIPSATLNELESSGADGKATAAAAQTNVPDVRPDRGGDAQRSVDADDGSFLEPILDAITGSDDGEGIGFLLPLILAGIAGAGLTYLFMRRRASQAS